jgi:hypothetical protein
MLAYFVYQSPVEGTVKLSYKIVLLIRPTFVNCSCLLSLTLNDDRNSRVGRKSTVFSNKEKMFKLIVALQVFATKTATKDLYIFMCFYIYIYIVR